MFMFQETEGCIGPTGPAGWGCRKKEAAGREGDQWVGEHQGEAGGDCGGSPGWKRHYDAADERWRVPNGKVRKLYCLITKSPGSWNHFYWNDFQKYLIELLNGCNRSRQPCYCPTNYIKYTRLPLHFYSIQIH